MKYHAGGYKIESARQRKARLNKGLRDREQQDKQGQVIATRYTDTLRDDGKDHTPMYTITHQLNQPTESKTL